MTTIQIVQFKKFAEVFKNTKELYKIQTKPLTLMPYMYGSEINEFIEFFYKNKFDDENCYEAKSEFENNQNNTAWFLNLPNRTLLSCLCIIIRTDRFVDGFIASKIEDGTVNRIIEALIRNSNEKY